MRLLFVNHTSNVSGGELCLLDLLAGLTRQVEPVVACPEGDLALRVRRLGVEVVLIDGTAGSLRLGVRTPLALAEIASSGFAIASISRRRAVDVIHANSIRAGLMGCVAVRCRGSAPMVVYLHDCLPPGRVSTLVRHALRDASTVVANSRYTARSFCAAAAHGPKVVYNPIDLARFDPGVCTRDEARRAAGLPLGRPLVGVVAQITPWKGQVDAIRALVHLRATSSDAMLVLAGSVKFSGRDTRFDNPGYLRALQEEVERLGLREHVLFVGERGDVPQLVRALDILMMPSWEEPFGRIAVEAMAMGTAVVATSVGGPPEFIDHDRTGLLIAPRDAESLGAAAAGLLADPARRDRIARAGQASARERFESDRHVRDMLAVYRALSEGRSQTPRPSSDMRHVSRGGRAAPRAPSDPM